MDGGEEQSPVDLWCFKYKDLAYRLSRSRRLDRRSGWQGVCESRDRLLATKVPNENTRTRCNTIDIVINSLTLHRAYRFSLLMLKFF